jgi:multiple antibiotic resistance protein
MHLAQVITFTAAMFAVSNPLGNLAIFISLTSNRTHAQIRKISFKCGIAVCIVFLTSIWLGNGLLHFFSIAIWGFEIAGGFVILMIALSMLQAQKTKIAHEKNEEQKMASIPKESIAVVPMAIPIMAGPGAMTTAVVAGQQYSSFTDRLSLSLGCIVLAIIITTILLFSSLITRMLGKEGLKIFTRIMGLLLMAIAFDLIIAGIRAAFPGLV